MDITDKQRDLVRHALGLDERHKRTYRNHFVTSPLCDEYKEWADLLNHGLARHNKGSQLSGGDEVFWATKELATFVLKPDEQLSENFRN